MWESIVTAGAVSLLAGLVAQPPRRYQFWRSWVPYRFALCILFYFACHAAFGVLVALLAEPANWEPSDNWFLNGLIYALVGQGVVRVAPQALSSDLTSSQTLLSRFIDFTVKAMNNGCEDRIEGELESLPPDNIAAQATWMYERYVVGDERLPAQARELMLDELEEATNKLQSDNSHLSGRGILERFCIRQFVAHELSPRSIKRTGSTSQTAESPNG